MPDVEHQPAEVDSHFDAVREHPPAIVQTVGSLPSSQNPCFPYC